MNAVMMPTPNFSPDLQHRAFVGNGIDDLAHVVQPQPVFRHRVTQPALIVRLPRRDRALEIRQIFLSPYRQRRIRPSPGYRRRHLVPGTTSARLPRACRCPGRRLRSSPGRPCRCVEPSVAMITSLHATKRGVAGKGPAVDDGDQRHQPAELRIGGEGMAYRWRRAGRYCPRRAVRRRPRRTAPAAGGSGAHSSNMRSCL